MKLAKSSENASLLHALRSAIGEANVFTDEESRVVYSTDFSEEQRPAAAVVVRPGSTDEVAEVVRLAAKERYAVVPRGGGMTYTRAYVPDREETVLVDTSRMNRVLEVNTDDLYITVEPGVTWKQIRETLRDEKYQIRFYGTLSGIRATVGGGLGNNAVGLGKGEVNDDLLGLEVVLYDGRIIQTGALATGPSPLLRHFGPDLTGVFVHDGGAMGIKTKASFRLTRKPGGVAYASFGFQDRHAMVSALCEMARLGVHTEIFGFERYHHETFANMPKPTPAEAKALLRKIVTTSPGRLRGMLNVLKVARPGGLKFMNRWNQSVHVVVEAVDYGAANRATSTLKRVARRHGASAMPPTFLIALRADPFMPVDRLIMGMDGACSFPSNCNVPLSRAHELISALEKFFDENAPLMKEHGLDKTLVYVTPKSLFGIEPILYWRDRLNPLRMNILTDQQKAAWGTRPADLKAREAAIQLRHGLRDLFGRMGGVHYGIGKYYRYKDALKNEENWRTIQDVKDLLDPAHVGNPGALGLV